MYIIFLFFCFVICRIVFLLHTNTQHRKKTDQIKRILKEHSQYVPPPKSKILYLIWFIEECFRYLEKRSNKK